jgi:hypothetical protein
LAEVLEPHRAEIARFVDTGRPRLSKALAQLWNNAFPLVVPPEKDDALGFMLLNSNADTYFSFTNALGLISAEQVRSVQVIAARYPQACWIIALHHHVVEYPRAAKALSERIGTALINGNWFVRQLQPLAPRALVMHGHRHIDWIGQCGALRIVSAPSPVMEVTNELATHCYIHRLSAGPLGQLRLLPPERIAIEGTPEDGGS